MNQRTVSIILLMFVLPLTVGFGILACTSFSNVNNIRNVSVSSQPKLLDDEMILLTYNIRLGAGGESKDKGISTLAPSEKSVLRITEVITRINPDIAALQEVAGFGQAELIARQCNLNFAFASHPYPWSGLAVLSKFPIKNALSELISFSDKRIALTVTFENSDAQLKIVNLHYPVKPENEPILTPKKLAEKTGFPDFIMGDFNIAPQTKLLKDIEEAYEDSCAAINTAASRKVKQYGTYYGLSFLRIDHIFVRKDKFQTINAGIFPYVDTLSFDTLEDRGITNSDIGLIDLRLASDHYAYFIKAKRR